MADQPSYPGQMGVTSGNEHGNVHDFLIKQHMSRARTMTAVKIVAVSDDGHTVDVQPLVNQVDGSGVSSEHGVVYGIQIHKHSGSNGTFHVVPAVGDIGMIHSADRDMSAVIAAKGPAAPGSGRTHDIADSVYMGGFGNVNGAPTKSMTWGSNGLTITNGSASYTFGPSGLVVTGAITATQNITAGQGGGDSVTLQNHKHAGGPEPDAGT